MGKNGFLSQYLGGWAGGVFMELVHPLRVGICTE